MELQKVKFLESVYVCWLARENEISIDSLEISG